MMAVVASMGALAMGYGSSTDFEALRLADIL